MKVKEVRNSNMYYLGIRNLEKCLYSWNKLTFFTNEFIATESTKKANSTKQDKNTVVNK